MLRYCCTFVACTAAFQLKVPTDFYDNEMPDIMKAFLTQKQV